MMNGEGHHWSKGSCGDSTWWTFIPDRPYGHIGIMVKPPKFWQSGSSKGVYSREFFQDSYWDKNFAGAKKGL